MSLEDEPPGDMCFVASRWCPESCNRTTALPVLSSAIASKDSRLGMVLLLLWAWVRGLLSRVEVPGNSRPSDIQPPAFMAMAPLGEPT